METSRCSQSTRYRRRRCGGLPLAGILAITALLYALAADAPVRNPGGRIATQGDERLDLALIADVEARADAAWPVYVMNADGSRVRKLAQPDNLPFCSSPQFSRDGKRVVFEGAPHFKGNGFAQLFTINADGSGLAQIGQGVSPSWSTDDLQLAFHMTRAPGNHQLWLMNADGSGREELMVGESPRFSPDGEKLAYLNQSTGKPRIQIYDLVNSRDLQVLEADFNKIYRGFSWSPDSKRLAFVGINDKDGSEIWLWRIGSDEPGADKQDGGAKEVLKIQPTGEGGFQSALSWSPDGKQILFVQDKVIYSVDVDSDAEPKAISPSNLNPRDPAWSPDGKQIVFVAERK